MDSSLLKRFPFFQERKKAGINQRIIVLLFFLFVAIILWTMNFLSLSQNTTLKYPVKYSGLPENLVLVNTPPDHIKLKVEAKGFTILKHHLSSAIKPARIFYKDYKNPQHKSTFILSKDLLPDLREQLNTINIIEVSPDTIYFQFSETIRKKVPVKANVVLEYKKQYMQSRDFIIQPDSIEIIGPKSIIDTINFILTEKTKIDHLDKTIEKNLDISLNHDHIKSSIDRVNITVPVEKYTEANYKIELQTVNLPPGRNLKTFPNKISCSFFVSLSDFKQLAANNFQFYVDYNDISETSDKLPVHIGKQAPHIKKLNYYPRQVEYIIEK